MITTVAGMTAIYFLVRWAVDRRIAYWQRQIAAVEAEALQVDLDAALLDGATAILRTSSLTEEQLRNLSRIVTGEAE